MPFEFIDNNHPLIDRAARKRIRSHAALGKNVGRKVMRPSRKSAQRVGAKVLPGLTYKPKSIKISNTKAYDRTLDDVSEIQRQVGDGLPVLPVPDGSRKRVRQVMAFFGAPRHVPALTNAMDPHRNPGSIWVELMFVDEAFYHCAIALFYRTMHDLIVEPEDPLQAAQHLSRTFRLVNQRISEDTNVSDATIAVVLMLVQYERHEDRLEEGLVHLRGLLRMIELRGGISQLRKRGATLATKTFRADLDYSLYRGTSTQFSVDDLLADADRTVTMELRPYNSSLIPRTLQSCLLKELSSGLWSVLQDVTTFAQSINDAISGLSPKLDCIAYHYTLVLFGYRLINIRSLNAPYLPNNVANTIHLGLMAFLTTFLVKLDHSNSEYPILYQSLRFICQVASSSVQDEQQVRLWAMFISSTSVFTRPDDYSWLIPITAQTMSFLGLRTWEEVYQTITVFPWVDALHNSAAYTLWLEVSSLSSSSSLLYQNWDD
ncbi:hypothetical protein BGW36DRAFT_433944 [Talaromyces proteolyticus]|uniref:Tachykinin family protein n=1 Tax=Talaromyces proteolyticus TaxID=1131652 RepID=A0AAD4PUC6_9EURO|nr:uncharacterized protein BGW36DRAFT_433944 [Talaromyces proteolyticus]KAH8689180.1 hypothetical protein BGW36DRAFT_433944 [Talaromyces proteolyticus]